MTRQPIIQKSLLDDLRHATEFYKCVEAENTAVETSAWTDAREWLRTAALNLGLALIAQEQAELPDDNSLLCLGHTTGVTLTPEDEDSAASFEPDPASSQTPPDEHRLTAPRPAGLKPLVQFRRRHSLDDQWSGRDDA